MCKCNLIRVGVNGRSIPPKFCTFIHTFVTLLGHLFFLDGSQWRNLRTKLTPAFTSGKMKTMFSIIDACSNEMLSYLNGKSMVEVGDLFTRYTTNVVTRCAFGIDVDFFRVSDPMLEKMVHRVGNPTFLDAIKRGIAFTVGHFTTTLPVSVNVFFKNFLKSILILNLMFRSHLAEHSFFSTLRS